MQICVEAQQGFDLLNAGAGLVGVVLGAALTYFVTYQFERRRAHDERLGRSYGLLFAVLRIADELTKMEIDLRAAIERAKTMGTTELWTVMTSSIGYSEPIRIPPEDLSVVALTQDMNLTTQIGESESAHRIYTQSLQKLDELKAKFEAFGLHTNVEGQIVSFEANSEQFVRVGPTVIQLRTLSESIAEALPKAAEKARSVAERLGPHLKKYYKFKHFITLSFPSANGTAVTEQS